MDSTDLLFSSITDVSKLLRSRQHTAMDLVRVSLDRIRQLNPVMNAFITETADLALRQAEQADAELQRGIWRGPLHGIPISLKDLIDTAGIRTTAASAVFADRIPDQNAEIVHRLRRAGAVIVGKTNLHEMAYGGSGVVSHYGRVKNPWNPQHITGGSSSGAAASVAAGMCFAAIATDTAGSVRLPASLCGLVGMKPTYGAVSVRGVIPLSWTYDHVGPIARTVADAALVLHAIAGYDPIDIHSRSASVRNYASELHSDVPPLRIGLPRKLFFADLDAEVSTKVESALHALQELGHSLREIDLPFHEDRTVSTAESYAYHSKFLAEHSTQYEPITLDRILKGESITTAKYLTKYEELQQIRSSVHTHFAAVDLIVTPTVPIVAPTFAELDHDPSKLRDRELLMLRNLRPFNVLGVPAISVPCGVTAAGLPVGLQIAAAPGRESLVFQIAEKLEKKIGWKPAILPKA